MTIFLIKRRQFFKFTGSALATIGLSRIQLQHQGDRYARVLAQDTPRKLALLVGINNYDYKKWISLSGAVNDVKLQKELLNYRFGFKKKDIVTLTDQEANYDNIIKTFDEHLLKQAKPGDVVVFHFSGHGSQVADPVKVFNDGQTSTLVPVDSRLPFGYPNKGGRVDDITGHTLWLLMASLDTENITFVLDSCHSGGARQGILTIRSRPGDAELFRSPNSNIQLQASTQEQEYQRQLQGRLNFTNSEFARLRRQGIPKGVLIAAAKRNQKAVDAAFADTNAGVFTYALTQYLWQETGNNSFRKVMLGASRITEKIVEEDLKSLEIQEPEFHLKPDSANDQKAIYFTNRQALPVEAIVTKIEDNEVEVFLGGVYPSSLEAFGKGAILTLIDDRGQEKGLVEIESRQQFTAYGKVKSSFSQVSIKEGQFLQERVRGIPSDLTLRIGLDPSLGNDINEAKQALESIRRVEALSLEEQEVQYIFGRVTSDYHRQLQQQGVAQLPEIGSIALFSPGLQLIPDSFGNNQETVTDAVNRLRTKFKSLLAARIIKLALNANSSRLNISAAVQIVDQEGVAKEMLANTFTPRGGGNLSIPGLDRSLNNFTGEQQIEIGKRIQILVQNNETQNIYVSILLISPDGSIDVLFPLELSANVDEALVKPGDTLKVPEVDRERFLLKVTEPLGIAEALIVASFSPLRSALKSLKQVALRGAEVRGESPDIEELRGRPDKVREPEEIINSLLGDLDAGTRGSKDIRPLAETSQIDTTQIAAMSVTFEIVQNKSLG